MKSIQIWIVALIMQLSFCGSIQAQNSLEPADPFVSTEAKTKTSLERSSHANRSPILSFGYNISLASWSKDFYRAMNEQLDLSIKPEMHNIFFIFQTFESPNLSMRLRADISFSPYSGNSDQQHYNQLALAAGMDFRYKFIQTPIFELAGTLGAGIQSTVLGYKNFSPVTNDSLLAPPTLLEQSFNVSQKILGYAAVGVEVYWRATPYLGLGAFVRWRQQIGHGYWYKHGISRESVRVSDLPKYSMNPLEIGLLFSITGSKPW